MNLEGRLRYHDLFVVEPVLAWVKLVACKACCSENHREFDAEVDVHLSGLKNLLKPLVFVFPRLLVCMDCGFTEFAIPETELSVLGKDGAALGTRASPSKG